MTERGAWMREYERRRAAVVYAASNHGKTTASIYATEGDRDTSRAALTANRAALDAHVRGLVEENGRLRGALVEIVKGEGPYSRDPLTHASNVIEAMTKVARNALAPKDAP